MGQGETHLKNKSELSKNAAQFLNAHSHVLSVPHCAYYSCYQLTKYIFCTLRGRDLRKEYADYKKKCNEQVRNGNRIRTDGLHEFLINEIFIDLSNSLDVKSSRTFNDLIVELKKIRCEADYEDKKPGLDYGTRSLQLMSEVLTVLNLVKK